MPSDSIAAPLGALATMATAAALTPLRETVFGNTNAALVLVMVVAATASIGGRGAGALSALTAALSYNFFLTRPYLSLHVDRPTDLATVALLLGVGLVIGEFARHRGRRVDELHQRTESTHRLERIARMLVSELTRDELCRRVAEEIGEELGLVEVRWDPTGDPTGLPVMERTGWVAAKIPRYLEGGFELPTGGVELPVTFAGARLGAMVLLADPGLAVSSEQRWVAVALADLLASALAWGGAGSVAAGATDL